MHVALVAPETVHHREPPLHPARERFERVATLLAECGHRVTVLTTPWWEADLEAFETDGVTYRVVADAPGRGYRLRLPLALRRAAPDVVHVDAGFSAAVGPARYGARLARVPVVGEFYDLAFDADAVTGVDRLVAPAETVRTRLREAGATAADVSVVPDPVDLDLIEATPPATAHEDDIVFAGRLDSDGNLESLLLALAELRAFDWSATVVGDGPLRSEHRRQARELRIDDRVRFVGDLDRRERVGVYRAARAFVQTARRRVFAEELLWALASGCVGVVEYHADSGAHELVERRDRGLRTTDETELVDALRSLSEYERRDRDADFDEYDRAAVAARLEECYRAAGAEG
ncbi:glycosyl transferase family 1 [Halobacteriales archaeon SW_5_70_135]|nr:MAG: glycosyl transferase family 1 [Halobacteriales archaeon SW_5_70_135]